MKYALALLAVFILLGGQSAWADDIYNVGTAVVDITPHVVSVVPPYGPASLYQSFGGGRGIAIDLRGADLLNTNLVRTDLAEANLTDSHLGGTNMRGAKRAFCPSRPIANES